MTPSGCRLANGSGCLWLSRWPKAGQSSCSTNSLQFKIHSSVRCSIAKYSNGCVQRVVAFSRLHTMIVTLTLPTCAITWRREKCPSLLSEGVALDDNEQAKASLG